MVAPKNIMQSSNPSSQGHRFKEFVLMVKADINHLTQYYWDEKISLIYLFKYEKTIDSPLGQVKGKHGKWHKEHCIQTLRVRTFVN